jgi:hypothetical protein
MKFFGFSFKEQFQPNTNGFRNSESGINKKARFWFENSKLLTILFVATGDDFFNMLFRFVIQFKSYISANCTNARHQLALGRT